MGNSQMNLNVRKIITDTINKREFCSEADFQHELAMEIERNCKGQGVAVFLEYPSDKDTRVDIVLSDGQEMVPIELKYKTKVLNVQLPSGATYQLKNQGAQDVGRYLFFKDIHRLENLKANKSNNIKNVQRGFAVFLTNDLLYTKKPGGKVCSNFCLEDKEMIKSGFKQFDSTAAWVTKYPPISITGNYGIEWQIVCLNGHDFYCLINEI